MPFLRLDGRGSRDAQARTLTYRWRYASGPGATLAPDETSGPTPTATLSASGDHDFELVVSNGVLDSPPSRMRVSLLAAGLTPRPMARVFHPARGRDAAPDEPPLAFEAGRETVVLDASTSASAYDPSGRGLRFQWSQLEGPSVALLPSTTASRVSFVPPLPGELVFDVTVSEQGAFAPPLRVRVRSVPPAEAPVALSLTGAASTTSVTGADTVALAAAAGRSLRVRLPTRRRRGTPSSWTERRRSSTPCSSTRAAGPRTTSQRGPCVTSARPRVRTKGRPVL
ncbi:MAG: hypothetical protein HY814_13570 [Candidatus Riflebacteria bacterium]|nr:hypothetical protein [Candidatus Riflebacteria bacterium]